VDVETHVDGARLYVISMRKATKRERKIYFESVAN